MNRIVSKVSESRILAIHRDLCFQLRYPNMYILNGGNDYRLVRIFNFFHLAILLSLGNIN